MAYLGTLWKSRNGLDIYRNVTREGERIYNYVDPNTKKVVKEIKMGEQYSNGITGTIAEKIKDGVKTLYDFSTDGKEMRKIVTDSDKAVFDYVQLNNSDGGKAILLVAHNERNLSTGHSEGYSAVFCNGKATIGPIPMSPLEEKKLNVATPAYKSFSNAINVGKTLLKEV